MFRRSDILIIPLVLLLVLALYIPTHAQYKHKRLFTDRFLHSPVKNENCTVCHDVHFSENPGQLADLPPQLCFRCHEEFAGKSVHKPVKSGDCNVCHYPHSSPRRYLLAAPEDSLCKKCHGAAEKKLHGEANIIENCAQCHDPHSTDSEKLLKQIPPEKCRSCHEGLFAEEYQHSAIEEYECIDCHDPHSVEPEPMLVCNECHDEILEGSLIHSPAEEDCSNCHEAHSGPAEYQLNSSPPDLCLECHDSRAEGKHGRVTLGEDCINCHNPHSSNQPGLLTKTVKNADCTSCHKKGFGGPFRHSALEEFDCGECHDPHGEKPVQSAKCSDCHDDLLDERVKHEPVVEGCDNCHESHSADREKLLNEEQPALCINCHDDRAQGEHGRVLMSTECLDCHMPHSSSRNSLLRDLTARGCVSCHSGKTDKEHVHTALAEYECEECHNPHIDPPKMPPQSCEKCHLNISDISPHHRGPSKGRCMECHDPHSSEFPFQMKKLEYISNEVCLECHLVIKRKLDKGISTHSPVKEGKCIRCHTTHIGETPFTREQFTTRMVVPYRQEAYTLCFSCHSSKLVQTQYTQVETAFRSGPMNLHFRHVVRDGRNGYSCWVCHDAHGSVQPRLVNQRIPFNLSNYPLKIELEKFDGGGRCTTNCHVVREYIR